jgi:thiol-disulfide isomerase/thioredoxin
MSSRSRVICLALIPLMGLVAGCDRAQPPAGQPDEVTAAPAPAPAAAGLDRSHKGEPAPAVAFAAPDGKQVTLASFRGKPLLVNLWATWCAPCIKELPSLDAARFDGVRVLAISQDLDAAKVKPFLDARGLGLAPYVDTKLGLSTAYAANLPVTILYDAAGKEVWRRTGAYDWASAAASKEVAEAI